MAGGESEEPPSSSPHLKNSVTDLQNQITSLQNRVKELEAENLKLTSQLSTCRCRKSTSVGLSPGNGLVSRGPSFTPEEDIALSHSWIDGSKDPVPGVALKRDTLWDSITDFYESRKSNHLPMRTTKSLQCRWNAISSAVKKFQARFRQVELENANSLSEVDIMTKAKIVFSPNENGKKGFAFEHVWPILKDVEKWDYNPYKQNHEISQSHSQTCPSLEISSSGDMNFDDHVPTVSCNQPLGKRRKMTDDSVFVTDGVEHSGEVSELIKNSGEKGNECIEKLENDCDRKLKVMIFQAENERRRLEYEKYDKEIKIMEKDVHSMTNPVQRSFFANLQEKIQAKWAHDSE